MPKKRYFSKKRKIRKGDRVNSKEEVEAAIKSIRERHVEIIVLHQK